MCEVYGVCPAPKKSHASSPPSLPLDTLTVEDVAAFVQSLGPSGARNTCPEGCTTVELYNATSYIAHGINGAALTKLIHLHDDRTWVHNLTLREKHANFLGAQGVFGAVGLNSEQRIALMTRLSISLRRAGYVVAPVDPKRRLVQLLRAARAEERQQRHRET